MTDFRVSPSCNQKSESFMLLCVILTIVLSIYMCLVSFICQELWRSKVQKVQKFFRDKINFLKMFPHIIYLHPYVGYCAFLVKPRFGSAIKGIVNSMSR